jgi:trans-aconitate 2-methyltransferase
MTWSPQQYLKFEAERNRPILDLLNALPPATVRQAVDIGCGPGNSAELLAARFPEATVQGFDSSPEMVAQAKARLPEIDFAVADVSRWDAPGPFDAMLSNAVLQWVPDHEHLLPRLVAKLAPAGSLAIQMPDNLEEPAHRLMREVAADPRWAARLGQGTDRRDRIRPVDWYYRLLRQTGARADIWRTTYFHALDGIDALVEWFKGTGLRPFLQPLDAAEQAAYLDRYRAALAGAYAAQPDGTVLLPFPRLFMIATR